MEKGLGTQLSAFWVESLKVRIEQLMKTTRPDHSSDARPPLAALLSGALSSLGPGARDMPLHSSAAWK